MSECVGGALNVRITTCGGWRCKCRIQSGRQAQHNRWKYGAVRADIAGVSHVTSRNIVNVNYPCYNPTSAKCNKFRPLHTLLCLSKCDISRNFIWSINSRGKNRGGGDCFFTFEVRGKFFCVYIYIIYQREINCCDNLNPSARHCANSRLALRNVILHLIHRFNFDPTWLALPAALLALG